MWMSQAPFPTPGNPIYNSRIRRWGRGQARPAGNRAICYAARAESPLLAAAASRSAEAMEDRHGGAHAERRAKPIQEPRRGGYCTVSSKTETSQARELKRSDTCVPVHEITLWTEMSP
ncbi:hypothetical protein BHE74_00034240 [Ensete ventricosum]|nr:hypothetical protein GW17_00009098 [Ensete ventricosum]RWW58861.1 hypothetical protein BHE74_00034240 [Ensete ventricosum]RZR85637.1 hypothetical protein BHM03_00012655 [Ensete ventricosum]